MENKINIAELLKDCPQGMELDCLIFEDVTLYGIDTATENEYPIRIVTNGYFLDLTKYGTYSNIAEAKCVIFPKGKTTWEGFQRPFKDGDIVMWEDRGSLVAFIYKERKDIALVKHHFALYTGSLGIVTVTDGEISLVENEIVFATEEEKQKLFDAIKANGYKWNPETKTLEKLPKFKVGDRIRKEDNNSRVYTINGVYSSMYGVEERDFGISIEEQDEYELVPNKFDITTLKPFESRVLARDDGYSLWQPCLWGLYDKGHKFPYITIGNRYRYCIPYKGNEHLFGTTESCDDFYKTWE